MTKFIAYYNIIKYNFIVQKINYGVTNEEIHIPFNSNNDCGYWDQC